MEMFKAEDIVKKENFNKSSLKKYLKCTVCGLYGDKKEIISNTIIKDNIYVDICPKCKKYLEEGGKLKKRKYFPEEIEDFIK